jgi:hypothetical protein
MKLRPDEVLYVQGSLGHFHRVTALFHDPDSTNAYLAATPTESVIAVFSHMIFLASTTDLGISISLR